MCAAKKLQRLLCGGKALLTPPQGLRPLDMAAMGCIMAACFFLFQFGDLDYGASISYAYLEGHFFDFYRYNKAVLPDMPGSYYLQPIYLLLAVWNVPMKLFGLTGHTAQGAFKLSVPELAWNKLLLVIFLMLCSIVVYKIACLVTERHEPAKMCMFLCASNPLAIYAIFMFGSLDIFGLTFTMLGLYAFLRHKHWRFILWFSLAIPFKYIALIPFLPLLLLDEKNVWKILRGLFVAAIPTVFFLALSLLDPGGADGEALRQLGAARSPSLDIGPMMRPAVFALAYLAICLFAHFKIADERQRQKYAIMLPLAAMSMIFVCMFWHAQWIILLAPWLALALLFSPNRTYSLLFETIGSAAWFIRLLHTYAWLSPPGSDEVLLDPSRFGMHNPQSLLGNFWAGSPSGYGAVRGFFQGGIMNVGYLIPASILPYVDAALLICLLSPFLLLFMRRKAATWPTPRLFKTEAGAIRLRCYGGLAAYLLPITAVSAAYAWFPDVLYRVKEWLT